MSTIEVKPIHSEEDYERTMEQIGALLDSSAHSTAADTLEVLSILADEYENKHYKIDAPDAIEAIKYKMEELHLSQKDLARYLGGENRVSEVLNRKRPLTLKMIRSLYHNLHIPASSLLA